jgi:hypothetical protein
MARILICHVPKDGSTARELGGALMGRGHFVSFDGEPDSPRADRLARLRQFEAVVVVWTEASYQSAGLTQIARETLPLNLLIPVRSETLEIGRLPLAYRKLNMFAPRDFDGLARLIARLSTAATSLKEMAEHAAKFEPEPRRELPPVVPKPARKLEPPPLPGATLLAPVHTTATAYAPLPPPIISAAHAQRTVRKPVHFDLPDVSDADDRVEEQPVFAAPRAQPAYPTKTAQPAYASPSAQPAFVATRAEPAIPTTRAEPAIPTTRAEPAKFAKWAEPAISRQAQPAVSMTQAQPASFAKQAQPAAVAMSPPQIPPQFAPAAPAPAPTSQMQQLRAASPPKMENAERPAPQPPSFQPEPPSPYSAITNAQDLSAAVEDGLLLHYIPEMMWLGEPGMVEVRLDRNVLDEYFGRTDPASGASVIETLSLSLYGTSDAFEIERLSERTQFVGGNSVVPEGLDRWAWQVTPRTPGTQDLVVRVSALLLDRHGVPAPVALPDRRFRVDVDVREGGRVMSSLSGWLRR